MDFVIIWVDGNDPEWKKEFHKYKGWGGDHQEIRFRDWNNLQYWFRGVEKFAPWVENIFFVTCGHYPGWLNLDHPQLHFIKHEDYIPSKYLPTFNSHTIELHLHRIKGLSEQFVYFNDDLFIINSISPERFFKHGNPCDMAVMNALSGGGAGHIILNDVEAINKHCKKSEIIHRHFFKWFNYKYGSFIFRNLCLLPWPRFTGFVDPHFPNSYRKSTFTEMWEKEYALLDKTCMSKFRESDNLNQYIMRYWQLVKGDFSPLNVFKDSEYIDLTDGTIDYIKETIEKQTKSIIVLNDEGVSDFNYAQQAINESFQKIFPEKSQYEKLITCKEYQK